MLDVIRLDRWPWYKLLCACSICLVPVFIFCDFGYWYQRGGTNWNCNEFVRFSC